MAAELIPSPDWDRPHQLRLPDWWEAADPVSEVRDALLLNPHLKGRVSLMGGHWPLRWGDFERLIALLSSASLSLERVCCQEEGARVAAAAAGLALECPTRVSPPGRFPVSDPSFKPPLSIHEGTLRSGDRQEAPGSLLILGDVNPGAQISAGGHVMVWGRLRGIAHAGRFGDRGASIVALHLHPLQLRIADAVARGPVEAPPTGLAEKAHLVGGTIQIDLAEPFWPLAAMPPKPPGPSGEGRGSGLA
jgi:septum site-determining protein MinC